jgi:hypothetical protein
MTPTEEVRFIELWQQGLESAEIARQLGIPRGTVSSRAATLVRQGKIQPRPRGGAYPKQQAKARQGQGHDAAPVQSGAVQSSAEPLTLTPDEARAERWNLWLPRGLRQRIEAVAKALGHTPSIVVQEVLWRWVTEEDR